MADQDLEQAVGTYVAIDVTDGSRLKQALMAKVEQEAANREITISSEGDSKAEGMTLAMTSWYDTYIAPSRTSAISDAQQVAGDITLGKGTRGVVERVEIDKERQGRARRRTEILTQFRNKHGSLLAELEDTDREFSDMRVQEGGRDPKIHNRWLEWGVLIPLIMIPESLLNFESFRRAPIIQSDAMALGVTIIVGAGIAVAAHLIGRFVRQFNFYMKPDNDESNRMGWPLWAIGSSLLLVALAVVGYARYFYLAPLVEQAIILGQVPPNIFLSTGGLLLGNLVVFFLGVAVTFMLHDSNPEFSDKARKLKKLQKDVNGLRNKEVIAKLSAVDQAFREKTDGIKRMTKQMENADEYGRLKSCVNAIEGKDREVIGVLSEYKQALIEHISRRNGKFFFDQHYSQGERTSDSKRLSLADYASQSPRLLWSQD